MIAPFLENGDLIVNDVSKIREQMNSSAEKWVNSEFRSVSFGDIRLNTRLINIVTRLASRFRVL